MISIASVTLLSYLVVMVRKLIERRLSKRILLKMP
jgi:hypothetical protein